MYTVLPQVFYDVAQECIEPFRSCFSRGAAFRHFANFVLSKCVGTYEHGVTDSISWTDTGGRIPRIHWMTSTPTRRK